MTKCFNIIFSIFICLALCAIFPVSAAAQHDSGSGHAADTEAHTLDAVTVTAEKLEEYIQNHPQRITVLERKEIQERHFMDIGEAIDTMPGVDVSQSGSSMGTRISIRGSAGSGNVLVLINGRPMNTSQYGSIDLGTIPIDIVKSITVFKPPVPVWLGPGASAGAINIVTHELEETRVEEKKKNTVRLKINGGSHGTANAGCSYVIPKSDGTVMLTTGGGHRDGKRENSDKDTGEFSFHWDKKTENQSQYDLNGRYYHSEHGSAGPTDNPTPDARQRYDKGSLDFRFKGFMSETGDISLKTYTDVVRLEDTSQSGDTSDLDIFKIGIKGDSVWSKDDTQALRLGGILERDAVDHTLSGNHHRERVSLHSQLDKEICSIAASFGIRGDYTNDFGWFPAFSSGMSYALGKSILLKVNAGYSVKIPSFSQLYQPAHGSMDQVRGNPDLSEENIWSYDAGIEYKFGKKSAFEAMLFRTDNKNMIAYDRDEETKIYSPINISKAYRQGAEFSLKYEVWKNFSADISYILQKTENRDKDKELTYAPRHKFKFTVKCSLPNANTKIEAILRASSRQYGDLENEDELDAYHSTDLKIIQPFTWKTFSSEVFVHFLNLFDNDFEVHHGYPDDRFRVMGGVTLNF